MKNGDVFFWSYNDSMLERLNDGDNGGTTYWCCSRYCIVKDGMLYDTFWSTGENRCWDATEAAEKLELKYLGNLNDYESKRESDRIFYSDKDCLNLNHPNSTRGNFYVRKGAKKDVTKMERVIKRNIWTLKDKIKGELRNIERFESMLEQGITEDTHVFAEDGVSITDESYIDNYLEDL